MTPLDSAWTHKRFGEATAYRCVEIDRGTFFRAARKRFASGLYRDAGIRSAAYPWHEWTWRVDRLQASADMRTKAGEDVVAAIFLILGQPGLFRPKVSTLAYVWTNTRLLKGEVVSNP